MTTLDLIVVDGADDAFETESGAGFDATNAVVRSESNTTGAARFGGHRFQNVTIPAGATIDVAYCSVHAVSGATDDPNVNIKANDVDNSANFTDEADVVSRARTTASVQWTTTGIGTGEVNTPSLVAVIQEVIDRAGWASGNALMIFFDGKTDANFTFRTDAFEGSTTECMKLHIEYTAAAAPVWPLPGVKINQAVNRASTY